jgi:DNA gyrase subunit A
MVYKLKTWRLPLGSRTSRGKAIVNILPIEPGTGIAAVMPVDREEDHWDELQIVFATDRGRAPQRAQRFHQRDAQRQDRDEVPEGESEGWRLINARIASNEDDVMLVTKLGRAIRFPATDVRVFKGRASTGVRGIKLAEGDEVVSMSIIRHFEAEAEERAAYLKQRRLMAGVTEEPEADEDEEAPGDLSQERYAEMSAAEDLILTITTAGSGKLSLIPRLSRARAWRPGRDRHGQGHARRPAGGVLPGGYGGPDHAGDLHRPVDPRAGRWYLVPLALRRGGEGLQHRQG